MNKKQQKTFLITGGAGFIGSNFIPYFLNKYPNYQVVNLDKLAPAGSLENLKEIEDSPRYTFIKGDVCNRKLVNRIFDEHDIDGVIHFAAETHVDNSIIKPGIFIKTNVEGTFTLLEAAKKHWLQGPFESRAGYSNSRFHHISTDEVYGSLGDQGLFTEKTPYNPRSPYSASKASSDLIVQSYYHTYGLNIVITNCSNNYGPKQYKEKFIPTIIRKALTLEEIPIYGDGGNVRDWLFVLDHCKGIDMVFHHGRNGEKYNIGGKNEQQNIVVALIVCDILDEIAPAHKRGKISSYKELITYVPDRPGHDRRYALDATRLEKEIGWVAEENFKTGIYKTVKWYVEIFYDKKSRGEKNV